MRKNRFLIFIILLIAIPFAGIFLRFLAIGPVAMMILVVIVVKCVKAGRKTGNENRKEEHYGTHDTGCGGSAGTDKTNGSAEANESADNGSDNDSPFITCEYCGSLVDTSRHGCCDHCGGTFWDNEEWKKIRNRRNR